MISVDKDFEYVLYSIYSYMAQSILYILVKKRGKRRSRKRWKRKRGSIEPTLQYQDQESLNQEIPVMNLSAGILSQVEIDVLSRGLNFCPTRKFNVYNTILDVNRFARSLTLRKHFCHMDSRGSASNHGVGVTNCVPSFLGFRDQMAVCTLRSLQQESTALIDAPKNFLLPGNQGFYPFQSRPEAMDLFQDLIERDLVALHDKETRNCNQNLNSQEMKALNALSTRDDITIRMADKGGGGDGFGHWTLYFLK